MGQPLRADGQGEQQWAEPLELEGPLSDSKPRGSTVERLGSNGQTLGLPAANGDSWAGCSPTSFIESMVAETAVKLDGLALAEYLAGQFSREHTLADHREVPVWQEATAVWLVGAVVDWKFGEGRFTLAAKRRLVEWLAQMLMDDPGGRRQLEQLWGQLCRQIQG